MVKSANPVLKLFPFLASDNDWFAKGSEFEFANRSGDGEGIGGAGAARNGPVTPEFPWAERGGAGLGGGCFAFFGGRAGLGLSERVGACRLANGSSPKGSLDTWIYKFKKIITLFLKN